MVSVASVSCEHFGCPATARRTPTEACAASWVNNSGGHDGLVATAQQSLARSLRAAAANVSGGHAGLATARARTAGSSLLNVTSSPGGQFGCSATAARTCIELSAVRVSSVAGGHAMLAANAARTVASGSVTNTAAAAVMLAANAARTVASGSVANAETNAWWHDVLAAAEARVAGSGLEAASGEQLTAGVHSSSCRSSVGLAKHVPCCISRGERHPDRRRRRRCERGAGRHRQRGAGAYGEPDTSRCRSGQRPVAAGAVCELRGVGAWQWPHPPGRSLWAPQIVLRSSLSAWPWRTESAEGTHDGADLLGTGPLRERANL